MCSRPQFTDLTYIGGTGPCGPMTIIFGSVIKILHIKFGANRSFHVPKIPVYRLVYMGGTRFCRPIQPIFNTDRPMANRSLFAKFEVHSSLRSDSIVITTDRQQSYCFTYPYGPRPSHTVLLRAPLDIFQTYTDCPLQHCCLQVPMMGAFWCLYHPPRWGAKPI